MAAVRAVPGSALTAHVMRLRDALIGIVRAWRRLLPPASPGRLRADRRARPHVARPGLPLRARPGDRLGANRARGSIEAPPDATGAVMSLDHSTEASWAGPLGRPQFGAVCLGRVSGAQACGAVQQSRVVHLPLMPSSALISKFHQSD